MCVSVAAATVYATGSVDLRTSADIKTGPSLNMKFGFGAEIVVGLPVVGNVSLLYMVGCRDRPGQRRRSRSPASCCSAATPSCSAGSSTITIMIEAKGSVKRLTAGAGPHRPDRAGHLRPRHQHLPGHQHQLLRELAGKPPDRVTRGCNDHGLHVSAS